MITDSIWIRVFNESPDSSVRLICCPHAGGSASAFTALAKALPPSVEALSIQYPGRMDRRKEPGIEDLDLLAKDICAALLPLADRPLAVFGHSMGAAVAFELTRCLEDAGLSPVRLVVSGRRSPSRGSDIGPTGDEDIVADLKSLGGTEAKLLDRPVTRELILSVVRKDYRANAAYSCPPRTTVRCPITFLLTDDDPYVDEGEALAWQDHTDAELRITSLPGGHFYLNGQLQRVVRELLQDLL
jgi:surfactin synthase thioesterase subunit